MTIKQMQTKIKRNLETIHMLRDNNTFLRIQIKLAKQEQQKQEQGSSRRSRSHKSVPRHMVLATETFRS